MASAQTQLKKYNQVLQDFQRISEKEDFVLIIHYSCESFYQRTDGKSARITSIAVRNLKTAQTRSFSIHQFAEIKQIPPAKITDEYDKLEKEMLDDFYCFVKEHIRYLWVHWNMRDVNYGFPAIAHRYKVLGGNPVEIDEANLFDLARALIAVYGANYVGHPRLIKLMQSNKISDRDMLDGANEAKAFEDREYVKLHQSTLRKVDIFSNILSRFENDSLRVMNKQNIAVLKVQFIVDKVTSHWVYSLLAIVALGITLITPVREALFRLWTH